MNLRNEDGDADELAIKAERDRLEMDQAASMNGELDEGMGEGDDDRAPAGRAEDDAEDGRAKPPAPRFGSADDDLAEEIAARQMEMMAGNSTEFDGDMSNPRTQLGRLGEEGEGDGEEGDGEGQGEGDAPPAEGERKVKLKVRGQDVEMTLEEALAAAQKTLAGDSYFEEGRRLLEEAKELRRAIDAGERGPLSEAENKAAERNLSDSAKDARRRLIEAVQYGSPEDAEEAFNGFTETVVEEVQNTIDQRQRKMIEAQRLEVVKQSFGAGQQYVTETYPAITQSPTLAAEFIDRTAVACKAIMIEVVDKLPADLKARFVESRNGPDDIRAIENPRDVIEKYAQMASKGYGVPPPHEVFKGMADIEAKRLNLTPSSGKQRPSPTSPARGTTPATGDQGSGRVNLSGERLARKEGLSSQPTRTGAPARSTGPAKALSMEEYQAQSIREEQAMGPGRVPMMRRR